MPWEVRESDGRYCVHKVGEREPVACHDTKRDALDQLAALYASERRDAGWNEDDHPRDEAGKFSSGGGGGGGGPRDENGRWGESGGGNGGGGSRGHEGRARSDGLYRFDAESHPIGRARQTPQGGLRAPAVITRSGLFEYRTDSGKTRIEYHPPEVVAASVSSLADAPVTDGHPGEMVTTENIRKYELGHVADNARFDEETGLLHADVVIQDGKLLRAVKNGSRRELSSGYYVKVDETPGRTPSGERYDAIVTKIEHNHAAMGPPGWARAGRVAQVRLDGKGNATLHRSKKMEIELGEERYDLEVEAEEKAFGKALAKLQADRDAQQARSDAAEAKIKEIEAERDGLRTRLDSVVLTAEVARCKALAPKGDYSKVATVADARRAALAAVRPDLRLDGKNDAYLEASLELLEVAPKPRPVDDLRGPPAPGTETRADAASPGDRAQRAWDEMMKKRNAPAAPAGK